jgi:hypothetical protein
MGSKPNRAADFLKSKRDKRRERAANLTVACKDY